MGKFLLVIALFGAVQAKPEPWFYHGYPHVPLVYTNPITQVVPASPCKNNDGQAVPCAVGWYHAPYLAPGVVGAPANEEAAAEVNIADVGGRTATVTEARKKREAEP